MGDGPIMFTAILDYARAFEVEDFDDFLYIIRQMDNAFLDESRKEDVKKRNKNHQNPSRNSG
jgi:hypothetical protein